jgi:hypothetical protein
MTTTLDILETSYPQAESPPQTTTTMTARVAYDGCWASSGTLEFVVVDDRLAANPINQRDPSGEFKEVSIANAGDKQMVLDAEALIPGLVKDLKNKLLNVTYNPDPPKELQLKLVLAWGILNKVPPLLATTNVELDACINIGKAQKAAAYVNRYYFFGITWHGDTIYVTPEFFTHPSFGSHVDRAAALIHELTHMLGTKDAAYFWQNNLTVSDTNGVEWWNIAGTYDTWIINGFSVPSK